MELRKGVKGCARHLQVVGGAIVGVWTSCAGLALCLGLAIASSWLLLGVAVAVFLATTIATLHLSWATLAHIATEAAKEQAEAATGQGGTGTSVPATFSPSCSSILLVVVASNRMETMTDLLRQGHCYYSQVAASNGRMWSCCGRREPEQQANSPWAPEGGSAWRKHASSVATALRQSGGAPYRLITADLPLLIVAIVYLLGGPSAEPAAEETSADDSPDRSMPLSSPEGLVFLSLLSSCFNLTVSSISALDRWCARRKRRNAMASSLRRYV